MSIPKPKFRTEIRVHDLVGQYYNELYGPKSSKTENDVPDYQEMLDYVAYNMGLARQRTDFLFHDTLPQEVARQEFYEKYSGTTPEGIITQYIYRSKSGNSNYHGNTVITQMTIDLFSFVAPVDDLKERLEELVAHECKSFNN